MLIKVVELRVLSEFRLALTFSDGMSGVVDLSALVTQDGAMVRPLGDKAYFARVFLEAGAPTWPNGFDLAPWALYDDLRQAGALSPSPQTA